MTFKLIQARDKIVFPVNLVQIRSAVHETFYTETKKNKKVTVLKTEPYLCAVKMTKVSHNGLTLRIKQVVKAVGISHSINTIEYDADSTFSINESIIDM